MNIRRSIMAMAVSLCSLCFENTAYADVVVCPLEEATKRLEDYNTWSNAQRAQQQMPILTELTTITSKAKNPSLPTGAQLAKTDLDRFQELRYQLLTIQAREIVDSGYLRDGRVIAQSAKAAYDLSQGRTFDEKDPQFFYYGIVLLLSVQHPRDQLDITTPRDKECSIEAGLHFYEQLMLGEINKLPFKEATDRLKVISQKYGLDTKQEGWVEKIRSLQEKQSARIDMGTVTRGGQILDYIKNIENLKALARVSILGYQSDLEDIKISHNEAELSKIGTGWSERAKSYDEQTQTLAGLLNVIAQKMPSDSAIQAQGRTKMLQQQGIIK